MNDASSEFSLFEKKERRPKKVTNYHVKSNTHMLLPYMYGMACFNIERWWVIIACSIDCHPKISTLSGNCIEWQSSSFWYVVVVVVVYLTTFLICVSVDDTWQPHFDEFSPFLMKMIWVRQQQQQRPRTKKVSGRKVEKKHQTNTRKI